MDASQNQQIIPLDIAVQLCAEIRADAELNWHTSAARWCWRCRRESGGNPQKRGFLRAPGNRGCALINARYAEQYA